jgi:hypothetical protein
MNIRLLFAALAVLLAAHAATAATCVNRFVSRSERQLQVVTLLTGKYTFQEAQAMAKDAKLEWIDEAGKTVAKQFGELKVVRPMPVGCDGKTSGVVLIASFGTTRPPSKKMLVKFDAQTTVAFDQQAD